MWRHRAASGSSAALYGVAACVFLICVLPAVSQAAKAKTVVDMNEDNWSQMLEGEWMVEFYAPWCPACKALQGTWREFAEWAPELNIGVAKVDVTKSPGLSGRFMVTALPTIYHVLNAQFRQYKGSRDKEAFMSFVEDRKWEAIEPVPGWKAPDSLQMSVVAAFFKLSQILCTTHTMLMDEYGLPSWGSYLIFAIATIFLGAFLGLILVCMIDFFFPQKPAGVSRPQENQDNKADESGDEGEDLMDEGANSQDENDDANEDGDDTAASQDEGAPSSAPNSPQGLKKRRPRRD